jgi:hypothetical protein
VSFSAFIPDGSSIGHGLDVILPFHSVITNVGGAYNPTSGVFTCPFDGEYYFSVVGNVWNFDDGNDVLFIVKNGNHIAAADKDDETSSVVVMTVTNDVSVSHRPRDCI